MPFTPLDISAVESIGAGGSSTSIIYYVDGDGILSSVQAAQQQGKPNNVIYDLSKIVQVLQNGNKFPVKPTYKFLDAVAYDYNGQRQVRVYFVGDANNSDPSVKYPNQLLELVNNNGGVGEWTPGKLNNLGLRVTIETGITANVATGLGNLKVYYNDADAKKLRVAWVVLGETAWTNDDLTAKPTF